MAAKSPVAVRGPEIAALEVKAEDDRGRQRRCEHTAADRVGRREPERSLEQVRHIARPTAAAVFPRSTEEVGAEVAAVAPPRSTAYLRPGIAAGLAHSSSPAAWPAPFNGPIFGWWLHLGTAAVRRGAAGRQWFELLLRGGLC